MTNAWWSSLLVTAALAHIQPINSASSPERRSLWGITCPFRKGFTHDSVQQEGRNHRDTRRRNKTELSGEKRMSVKMMNMEFATEDGQGPFYASTLTSRWSSSLETVAITTVDPFLRRAFSCTRFSVPVKCPPVNQWYRLRSTLSTSPTDLQASRDAHKTMA